YHHYGPGYSFGHDLIPSMISQALIIHPIKDQNTFEQIFAFYLQEKKSLQNNFSFKKIRKKTNYITFLSNIEFDLVRDIHYQSIDARWKSYIKEIVRLYAEKIRRIWHKT